MSNTTAGKTGTRFLWLFTLFAVVGFATFGRHPELLARFPSAAGVYGPAFGFFSVGQVWIAWAVLALFLAASTRLRWIPAFVALYAISLSSELAGTSSGFPFGAYDYTALMEPKWFGRVPIVIPLSWFYMAIASYAIAPRLLGRRTALRIPFAALVLTVWDLSLDPAMSFATKYWAWETGGVYYGMPAVNLLGWFGTGLLLMAALHLLKVPTWLDELPATWFASFYLANLFLPVAMNIASGLWLAGVVGVVSMCAGVVLWKRGSRVESPRSESGRDTALQHSVPELVS